MSSRSLKSFPPLFVCTNFSQPSRFNNKTSFFITVCNLPRVEGNVLVTATCSLRRFAGFVWTLGDAETCCNEGETGGRQGYLLTMIDEIGAILV